MSEKASKKNLKLGFAAALLLAVAVADLFLIADQFFSFGFFRVRLGKYSAFSDFAQTVRFCLSDNPFKDEVLKTSYAPAAFLIIYPFAVLCKGLVNIPYDDMKYHYQFWVAYALFFAILTVAFIIIIVRRARLRGKKAAFVSALFVLSSPYLYLFSRGNIILVSAVFLLLFLCGYNSEKRWVRELSLAALAFSGVIKFYTLIFGVLLMRQSRMQDCVKVLVYFLALFFLPFVFYDAGTIGCYLENMKSFVTRTGANAYMDNASLANIFNLFFSKALGLNLDSPALKIIIAVIVAAAAVSGIFAALFIRGECALNMLLIGLMFALSNPAYFYMAVFYWFVFADKYSRGDFEKTEKAFFFIIFVAVFHNKFTGVFIQSSAIVLMTAMLIVKGVRDGADSIKNGRGRELAKGIITGFKTNGRDFPGNSSKEE